MDEFKKVQEPDLDFLAATRDWAPRKTIVRCNNKTPIKTISATNYFNHNDIGPIKILAPRSKWIEWEEEYLMRGEIKLASILDFVSRLGKKSLVLPKLKIYAKDFPFRFSEDFYNLFVWPANAENIEHPFNKVKPRGGSPYGWTRAQRIMVRSSILELYVCFQYWVNKQLDEWPSELVNISGYSPPSYGLEHSGYVNDPVLATMHAMKSLFGIEFESGTKGIPLDRESFYRNWIHNKRLLPLMRLHCRHAGFVPSLPYKDRLKAELN